MTTINSWTLVDYDTEKSNVSIHTEPLAADGSNRAAIQASVAAIGLGILGVTRVAGFNKIELSDIFRGSNSASVDPDANREEKYLVVYEDATEYLDAPTNTILNPGYNKKFNLEIPVADLSLRANNSEVVYTAAGGGVAAAFDNLVTALENGAYSPYGGAINVLEIRSVGRNT